ncbi:MAG: sugar nucleotide-binding protein [Candidatus Micrarchaeota archaeon]
MSFLVIGASGLVGYEFYRQNKSEKDWHYTYRNVAIRDFTKLDANDKKELDSVMQTFSPSTVIVPAAMAYVDGCEKDPETAQRNNVGVIENILESMEKYSAKRIVFFSTDYLFDGKNGPYSEDSKPNPINVYGKLKLECEQKIINSGFDYLIIRTTGIFGWEKQGKNFTYRLRNTLSSGKELVVPNDQFANYTYVRDLVSATLALLKKNANGIFNVAAPEVIDRETLAKRMAPFFIFNLNSNLIKGVPTSSLNGVAPRPMNGGLSIDKIISMGIRMMNLEDALKDMIARKKEDDVYGYMEDKVSVIMPCYNQVNYIRESVDSVLNQTYKNIELILIDNVSTDGTKEVIQEYEKKDRRVKAIYHKENMGYGGSINDGFANATGKYIALTSSDDIWYLEKLDIQVLQLISFNDSDLVHSDADIIDGKGKKTGTIRKLYRLDTSKASGNVFDYLTTKNICCTSTVLFRKECLKTYGEFDPELRFAHDWWFYIKLSQKHKFYYCPERLVAYRVHSTNVTRNKEWVYSDYVIIHRRLAEMGVDSKSHYISAALASSVLGQFQQARRFMAKAKESGKLTLKEKAIYHSIMKFNNISRPIGFINKARHAFSGFVYKFTDSR